MVSILFHYTRRNSELQQASSKIQTHKWIQSRDKLYSLPFDRFKIETVPHFILWKFHVLNRTTHLPIRLVMFLIIFLCINSMLGLLTTHITTRYITSMCTVGMSTKRKTKRKRRKTKRRRQSLSRLRSCSALQVLSECTSEIDQSNNTHFLWINSWLFDKGPPGPDHCWVSIKPPG